MAVGTQRRVKLKRLPAIKTAGLEASSAGRGAVGSTGMHQRNVKFTGEPGCVPALRSRQCPVVIRARKVPYGTVMNTIEVADRWFNSVLIKGANECWVNNEGWEAGARRQTCAEAAGSCTGG